MRKLSKPVVVWHFRTIKILSQETESMLFETKFPLRVKVCRSVHFCQKEIELSYKKNFVSREKSKLMARFVILGLS